MNLRRHHRYPIRLSSVVTGPMSDESVGMTVNLLKQGSLIEIPKKVHTEMAVSLRITLPVMPCRSITLKPRCGGREGRSSLQRIL